MNRRMITLPLCMLFAMACLTTTTPRGDAVGSEVAGKLTSIAALTQSGGTPLGPAQDSGSPPGELPTVTPTGTPLPSATATATPTITQTPSFTPPADDPRLTLGSPNYRTDFPDATNWYLYEDENVKFEVSDHKFVMTAKNANSFDGWTLTAWKLANYYLEMTATPDTCSGRDRYGLVVGQPAPGENPAFLFKVSCDGSYSFGFFDFNIDAKFHYLKEWTKSSYIYAGANQTNRVGFMAEGTHLSLYANGHFLADLNEPTFGEGRFGLFVGSVNTANFVVRVSEVAYWILP